MELEKKLGNKVIWHITHGVELGLSNNYADSFINMTMEQVNPIYRDFIIPHATNWSEVVEQRQEETWEIEKDLGLSGTRKNIIKIVCDLLWYRNSKGSHGIDIYQQIHGKLERELIILKARHGEECKVVRFGHSLGSQIMLDSCFESKYQSHGLITTGSPITKYSGMFPDWGHLPERPLSFWHNFYAKFDLVASSFKHHKSDQIRNFVKDTQVINLFNPMKWGLLRQHICYWNDKSVAKKTASLLTSLLA